MRNFVHKVIDIDINPYLAVTEVTESGANVLSDTYKPLRSFSCLGNALSIRQDHLGMPILHIELIWPDTLR